MKKTSRRSVALRPTRIAIAVGAAFLSSQAVWADPTPSQLPTGGSVAAGTVSISTAGSKMQVDQASDRAIINWQNFSIGKDGWVNFSQPSSSSVVLNRSTQAAEIFGRLSANGQVFVTSGPGVYFARTAQVDVGGLVATSLSISDRDFLAGRYYFFNEGNAGPVSNEGNIVVLNGYAALAGPQVQNSGVIVAQAGSVALAAGDRVSLDMVGDGLVKVSVDAAALNALALNSGTIQADGGRVILTARSANALLDTVINNTGVIRARSLVERDGEIVLDGGGAGVVANSGTLDASGSEPGTAGGTVTVRGQHVYLAEGSSVDASGVAGGGTVVVKGDETAYVRGGIDARGTGDGASGGFVETSGHYLEVAQAPEVGTGGTWLIDPYNIDIVAGGGASNNDGAPTFNPNGDNSQIGADLITGQLDAGTNVIVDTGGAGSPGAQAGDIRVLAAIDKTVANPASLSLKAFHDVHISQPITIASAFGPTGFGTLTVEAGNDVVVSAPINLPGGGLNVRAGGFTNLSAINNGVGGDLKPGMAIFADRFDLAGGTINGGMGSVGLFTRTNTNTLGVEAAGDTRITNADIASITTSPDSPLTNANQLLIGVGPLGTMRIGDDVQVDGGGKNLVFSGGFGPGTRITVGANGVTTTGDVVLDGSGGAIAGSGTVGGNRVVLRAGTGIGAAGAGVTTAANTLAINTGGNAFVTEADNVTLDNIAMMGLTFTNGVGGTLDFAANGSVTVGGIVFAGSGMSVDVGQDLNVVGSPGRSAILTTNGQQTISATNLSLQAAASGTNGRAIIANTGGIADQTVNVTGTLRVTGGDSGLTNAAAILTNGNQAINGNAEITLTGGASGTGSVATQTQNSASIQSNGAGRTQTINAASITLKAGGGNDSFAGISAANQLITVAGDVDIKGGSGTGLPIARIGGIGTPAGATNLNLFARDVTMTGGDSVTGEAGLGGTVLGAGPQPNTITITASRDVTLNGGTGGARIGTALNFATPAPGDISVSAGRDIQLNSGVGAAAIRTAGNVTLNAGGSITENQASAAISAAHLNTRSDGSTSLIGNNQLDSFSGSTLNSGAGLTVVDIGALHLTGVATDNGAITLTADSLSNAAQITNGGAASTANIILNGNAFTLVDGTVDGGAAAVVLRPRTGTNSFGIEAAGDTTLTNADIATINTSNFIVFGSGIGTTFTGSMTIGESAQVAGGGRNLAFFRSSSPGGTTIVGSQGAATTGDLIVSAGGGAIVSNGGVVAGDEVQLRASQGIGAPGAPVQTSANALASNNAGGAGVFVAESDDVTLRSVALNVGGMANVFSNFSGGAYDLTTGGDAIVSGAVQSNGAMSINAGGDLNINAAGPIDASLTGSSQSIAAQGVNLNAQDGRRATIVNTGGNQAIHAGSGGVNLNVLNGAGVAQVVNLPATTQTVITTGSLNVTGGSTVGSTNSGVFSNAPGARQEITAASITLQGADVGVNAGALINANAGDQDIDVSGSITVMGGGGGVNNRAGLNAGGTQTIDAGSIAMRAGTGGTDTSAALTGTHQFITASGDVLISGGGGDGTANGSRIGGLGGAAPSATDLTLNAGRDVIVTGGATTGASIGSTVAAPTAHTITVNAGRDVLLNAANAPVRIGTSLNFSPAQGDVSINAVRDIQLNGAGEGASIRTAGSVSLNAGGSIAENQFNAVVLADALTTTSGGSTHLIGANQVASFNGSSGGDLSLTNASDLTINNNVTSSGGMALDVAGKLTVSASGAQDAFVHSFGGQTITARAVEVSARDGRSASLWNTGPSAQSIATSDGAGVDVVAPSGGGSAQIMADGGSSQSVTVVNGDHINVNGATGSASIIAFNTSQTLSITGSGANAITLGSAGALGGSFAHASRDQSVTAGNPGEAGSITIVGPGVSAALAGLYDNPNPGGTQTISTSGLISITGGSAASQLPNFFTGIAHNGSGQQTITAAGIALTGGQSGNGNGVTIGAFGGGVAANAGAQVIDVGGGSISVTGGTGGNANTALINALRDQTILAGGTISVSGGTVGVANRAGIVAGGNQTLGGGADIVVTGGSSGGAAGNGNNAFINSTGGVGTQQTLYARSLNLLSGTGGTDNSASMGARKQVITVDGDVNLIGGASAGIFGGVRLGGLGGAVLTDTDLTLTLNNAGNLTIQGGSVATNIAAIGSTGVTPSPLANTINISTSGNVVLNPGASSARIGNSATAPDSGGDISVIANRIELNGSGATPTLIRTSGNVTLNAGPGGISEGSNGFVQAGSLSLTSFGPIDFAGPNQVGTLNVLTYGGDLDFNNIGNLNLAQVATTGNLLGTGNALITNAGDVSVGGFVTISGALTMNVAGALKLDADATHDASVSSNGQTINAQSLVVRSLDNRFASLLNNSGDQVISIVGGSVDVENASPGGFAQIWSFGPANSQSITVTNGDHININGGFVGTSGNQAVSITGNGANRISVGSAGALRSSTISAGRNQIITAGTGMESGSITIVGSAANNTNASIGTASGSGTTQTVSTSGELTVVGGSAIGGANTGVFHSGTGLQSVGAANIVLQGGTSVGTSGGGAFISNTNGGGDQDIFVTGTISLTGGAVGQGNRAFIITNGNQQIHGDPNIVVTGGAGGGGTAALNTSNGAGIVVNVAGRQQTIQAAAIALAGGGGNDSFAVISAPNQLITASGDVRLTGGSGPGLSIARLGGGGQPAGATNLTLNARDVVLTGGSAAGADAGIGSTPLGVSPLSGTISINAERDVILNSGTGTARIGTSPNFAPPAGGDVTVVAGRDIQLNGATNMAAIRTADNVVLTAGGSISEGANGFIAARELTTKSGGAQSLFGPNQVSRFTADAASGDVSLRNAASVLTLGSMDLSGSLAIDQSGALAVPGTVSALSQSIQATGDVAIGGADGAGPAGLFGPGAITIRTPQSIVLRGSDIAEGASSVVAAGGLATLEAGDLYLTGGAAPLAAASVLAGELVVTTARNIELTSGSGWNSNALLYSASDITMTVGGILVINGGHSEDNWARVQTQNYDGRITLNFPNLASGGVSVDGFADRFKHGQDGLWTADKPAKLGETLFINYGL